MEKVIIRFAKKEDINAIMEFIREYWSKDHIYANNREFFEYMHLEGENFNFVIGEGIETKKIYGMEGFVKYNSTPNPDISGCMWKAIRSSNIMLGIDIDRFMAIETNSRIYCGGGVNIHTAGRVANMIGNGVGRLLHYYKLNDLEQYHIAVINNKKIIPFALSDLTYGKIEHFDEFDKAFDESQLSRHVPYKDKPYMKHRYFDHPVYRYEFYTIMDQDAKICAVVIGRGIALNGSKVFRIVDYVGEDIYFGQTGSLFEHLIRENQYEFIDFYCYGIEESLLTKAGFVLREREDENIIPNYYEPFEQRNIEIYFPMNDTPGLHIYKGDGDQDRPSRI